MIDLSKGRNEVHNICLGNQYLNGLKARVAWVIDYSGSMSNLYNNGIVQRLLEKLFPIALEFDDNGQMESWLFTSSFERLNDVTMNNIEGYINNEIIQKGYKMGATSYAPVMRDVFQRYVREEPSYIANYVIFITDGDNDLFDKTAVKKFMKDASKESIFWQFVGLGNSTFSFLEKLDDMKFRYVDNADFFVAKDINAITYNELLNEFSGWLANEKVQNMLH